MVEPGNTNQGASGQGQQLTLPQALQLADRHLGAGDLATAEDLCRKVVRAAPNHPGALHLLAIICFQKGDAGQAVDLLTKTVSIDPSSAEAYKHLGIALQKLGRWDDAVDSLGTALKLQPDFADAHYILGNVLQESRRYEEAILSYQKAISTAPDFLQAHANLGSVYKALGQYDAAVESLRKGLKINPEDVISLNNLGSTLMAMKQFKDALACFEKVIQLSPDFVLAWNNKGLAQQALNEPEKSLESYRKGMELDTDLAELPFNLGNALMNLGRFEEAVSSFYTAIARNPKYCEAFNNQGNAYQYLGRFDEAIASFQRALEINPNYADAHGNLGLTYQEMGQMGVAQDCFEKALELDPKALHFHSNLLLAAQYDPDQTPERLFHLHRIWDSRHGVPHRVSLPKFQNQPDPDRRLRVGFISPDLGNHPVGYFALGLFQHLPKDQIDVAVYSDRFVDGLGKRLREVVKTWRNVASLTDEELCDLVREDKIDILFDLAGHTGKRLLVFARQAVPLQVTWAGYVGTTGLQSMDYLLSDTYSTRMGEEAFYSEKILRMPDGWVSYTPPEYAPDVAPLPLVRNGFATFASFNHLAKINDRVVALWARILSEVADAKLLLKYRGVDNEDNARRLKSMFWKYGIGPERLILEGRSPHSDLLQRYNDVDIALDPFPYSGGLTTLEALWMGVPVISLPGTTFASRHSLSHLSVLGHPEWIASTGEDYVRLAVQLAGDPERLSTLRSGLRETMAASPICDGSTFATAFNELLRSIWRNWCKGN